MAEHVRDSQTETLKELVTLLKSMQRFTEYIVIEMSANAPNRPQSEADEVSQGVRFVYEVVRDHGKPIAPREVAMYISSDPKPEVKNRVRQILHRHKGRLFEQQSRGKWTAITVDG